MQQRGGIHMKFQLKDKEEKIRRQKTTACVRRRQQNVEKALFKEILVDNILALEYMKLQIQEAERIISQTKYMQGLLKDLLQGGRKQFQKRSLRYQKKKKR